MTGRGQARAVLNYALQSVRTCLSAAVRRSPSGIRRPRARIGGLRGSPTPRATGRAACRRRRIPSAHSSCSRCTFALTLPRGSSSTADLFQRARPCAGRQSPSPAAPDRPSSSNALPGTSRICWRPSVALTHSTRTHSSAVDLAVRADGALGQHRPVALAAFFMRRRGAQLERPVGPGQRLVLACPAAWA